jgi:hypothetical protein
VCSRRRCARGSRTQARRRRHRLEFEAHVQQEVAWFRGRGLTFTADGFFAAFDGPARAISLRARLAAAVRGSADRILRPSHRRVRSSRPRAAGRRAFERARAVCASRAAGEVLVSRTVTDLVAGSGLAFVDRGAHPLEPAARPGVSSRPLTHLTITLALRSHLPPCSATSTHRFCGPGGVSTSKS